MDPCTLRSVSLIQRNLDRMYLCATCPLLVNMEALAVQERATGSAHPQGHSTRPIRVYVISPMRIYREGLNQVLSTRTELVMAGSADTFEAALPVVQRSQVDVVLYDLRCSSGLDGLRRLADAPEVSVVGLGVEETIECVIACAEAGISGYVTDSASLDELVMKVADAARGELNCPPHIAASLLRRIATTGHHLTSPQNQLGLTSRELEVAALVQQGLSNKQIASRLTIQLATVKNHVHSILTKLETPTRSDAAAVLRSCRTGHAGAAPAEPWSGSTGWVS